MAAIRSAALAAMMLTAAARAQSPFRYDDDLSAYKSGAQSADPIDRLKYIPLGSDPDLYLSFGADLRERVEIQSNMLLGFGSKGDDAYDLHRLLVYADLQLDHVRVFVQLGDESEVGRAPAPLPTDVDRLDLAQAFLDYAVALAPGAVTLRGGRFEMAYDEGALIGLRDGPNVRQVWDGLQASYTAKDKRIDAFLVRPVNVSPGAFDDHDVRGQTLWGVHVAASPTLLAPFTLTAFYYGDTMPDVLFLPRPGKEETHTAGLRLQLRQDAFDGSVGAIGQIGAFDRRDVRAYALHADVGWSFAASWSPRVGLRGDRLSGGGGAHGAVTTFNALYPNYAYSTEATIESPSNLTQAGVTLAFHPSGGVTLNSTFEGLWRTSTADAFYAAPEIPLVAPSAVHSSFTGTEGQQEVDWHVNKDLDLTAAYVHFEPGTFLRAAHARSQDFGMIEISTRF